MIIESSSAFASVLDYVLDLDDSWLSVFDGPNEHRLSGSNCLNKSLVDDGSICSCCWRAAEGPEKTVLNEGRNNVEHGGHISWRQMVSLELSFNSFSGGCHFILQVIVINKLQNNAPSTHIRICRNCCLESQDNHCLSGWHSVLLGQRRISER
jgi:hypothetical protein